MFECVKSKVVSSANNKAKNFEESCRSLIYKIKSRGPKMEPCGTPNVMFSSGLELYHRMSSGVTGSESELPLTQDTICVKERQKPGGHYFFHYF